jgi:O-antigen/teichoic acid export membrane protein
LSSIVGWFSFFDIGLTQGLRNKFSEARANGDDEMAQVYVSTTYAILLLIFGAIWGLFMISNQFINWSNLIGVSENMQDEISQLAIIVFTYFCLQFVLRIVSTIIIAGQEPAKASLIDLVGQIISLVAILFLIYTTEGSLIYLSLALCIAPIVALILANLFFFRGGYRRYRPILSAVRLRESKALFGLGVYFFVIQFAGIIQFETANFIIARNFGTSDVASYNIVYKYFSILNMLFAIFLAPFWSASTEAYIKKDFQWVRNGIRKYNLLNIFFLLVSVVMLVLSDEIFEIWLGENEVKIDFRLCLWAFIFFNLSIFGGKFCSFLNGINALRLQFLSCLISPILFLVAAFLLIKYLESSAYVLFVAAIISNFNGFLLAPVQYYMIIIRGKGGIWLK